ncbi:proline/serine-rich coiled-coil protein 1 [Arapaima gigas]
MGTNHFLLGTDQSENPSQLLNSPASRSAVSVERGAAQFVWTFCQCCAQCRQKHEAAMDLLARERSLISDEKLHSDWERPWWDSPEPQPNQEGDDASIPGKHLERGIARVVDEPGSHCWSPLSAVDMEHICQEANRLARQLHRVALKEALAESPLVTTLRKGNTPTRSPRRETYVVKDSPVRLLLPDVSLDDDLLLHTFSDRAAATAPGDVDIATESIITPIEDKNTPPNRKTTPTGDSTTPSHCMAVSAAANGTAVSAKTTSTAGKHTAAGRKDFSPVEKAQLSGEEAICRKDKHTAARDRVTCTRGKTTSGVAAHRPVVPGRGRGLEPKTCSLGLKQRDPGSTHGPQKKEHRSSQVVVPASHRSISCLPRTSHTREPVGRPLTESRLLARNASHKGGKLPGRSAPLTASTQPTQGAGRSVSLGIPKPVTGRSLPQPRTQVSNPGLRKGLCCLPATGSIPVTQQGSSPRGARATPPSRTSQSKRTQTASQRAT